MLHSAQQGGVCNVKDAQLFRPSILRDRVLRCCALLLLLGARAQAQTVAQVQRMVDGGQFQSAETQIKQALARPSLSEVDRRAFTYERERMRRILLDFKLSADDAQARLRKQIPDLKPAEFAAWDAAGLLEHQVIDGRTLYFNRAPSNLFRLSADAVKRRSASTPPWTDGPNESANAHHREVRDEAMRTGKHSVAAAPRARDLFAHRECRRGAKRRNDPRLAAVSARAPGSAGRFAIGRERARATPGGAGVRVATDRLPGAKRGSRQARDILDYVRADGVRPVPTQSIPPR